MAIALGIIIIGVGFCARYVATSWGLPYAYLWDEPEIVNPAIRVLRDGVYRPTRFAYGPLNAYLHAGWGALSVLKAVEAGEILSVWDLKTDWDTGWPWTISSPLFHRQARIFSVLMWAVTALAVWGACRQLGVRVGVLAALGLVAFSKMNFEQTSVVTVGAVAAMFSAFSYLAALSVLGCESGHVRPLWWTAIAAGAATASKLVFFPMMTLPLVCYVGTVVKKSARLSLAHLALWAVAPLVVFAVLMLPAFFDPPRFLHSLTVELRFYGDLTAQQTVLQHLKNAFLCALAASDLVAVGVREGSFFVRKIEYVYLPYVALGALGLIVLFRRHRLAAAALLIPALTNMWQISAYTQEFFPRNLLISQLALAVLAACGTQAVVEWLKRRSRFADILAVGVLLLCFVPPGGKIWEIAIERATMLDSRLLAQEKVDELRAHGRKVAVASELHWFVPVKLSAGGQVIPQVSLPRLLRHPEEAKEFDFVVIPLALALQDRQFHSYSDPLNAWSTAVKSLKPTLVFGDNATYYDACATNPKLGIVPREAFGAPLRREAPKVYAAALSKNKQCGFPDPVRSRGEKLFLRIHNPAPDQACNNACFEGAGFESFRTGRDSHSFGEGASDNGNTKHRADCG